jgi:nucleotide-binding universal stress UspA family protein
MASGVTARFIRPGDRLSILLAALDRTAEATATDTARRLSTRWPDAGARLLRGEPSKVIVAEAARTHADVIVMGWRGQGAVRRLLTGSVSRAVVREAACAVLVTRHAATSIDRIVLGVDGSSYSLAAYDLISRLASKGRRLTLFTAIDTTHPPSQIHLTAAVRATIGAEVERLNRQRRVAAEKSLRQMQAELSARGWKVTRVVTAEAPLDGLLRQVAKSRADLLVVGARGVTGLNRLLLGSVADGALNRSPVPVLIVK